MPFVARIPASCPAPVASTGGLPRVALSRSRRSVSNVVSSVQDSSSSVPPASRTTEVSFATTARTSSVAGPRASTQAVTDDGIALTPFGSTRTLPQVATVPCRCAASRAVEDQLGVREHRIAPVCQPGGARRDWPRRAVRRGTGRAARSRWRPRPAPRGRSAAGPARRAVRRTCRCGAAPSSSRPMSVDRPALPSASAIVTPCRRAARARARVPSAPVSSREPAHANPKRAPSSSQKLTMPIGRDGVKPSSRSASTAANAETTPSGPSYGTAVGDRIEVAAGDDSGRRVGIAPPRPLVAAAVDGDVQSACVGGAGEPLAQIVVGARPGEASVSAVVGSRPTSDSSANRSSKLMALACHADDHAGSLRLRFRCGTASARYASGPGPLGSRAAASARSTACWPDPRSTSGGTCSPSPR